MPGNDAAESARVSALFETARQTRGFMPDDEGEALFAAALRAGRAALPAAAPPTFVEITSGRSSPARMRPSTSSLLKYPGAVSM